MYLDFFKFRKNPFHITPDPDFLFPSPSHNIALSSISRAVEQRRGLVAVTGEVGVGKTTILRSYLEGTDPAKIRIVYIFNAALSFRKLMQQIVFELDIPTVDKDLPELIDSFFLYLHDEYKNNRRVVLIIDEAQNLPVETLERFQMLSNRESNEELLQVILVGQPEFENKLNLPELKDLKQRIESSCRIGALQPDESHAYIQHRLMKASSFHNPVFTKDALERIVKEARGIPRIINVVCDNALITAFGYQRNPVDDKIIKEVIKDLRGVRPQISLRWEFVLYPALVGFLGLAVLASMAIFMPKEIPPRRTEILSAKNPALPPAAETVKKREVAPPVRVALKAEPEPSIPGVQATGSDKSVSVIAMPAPVQRQTPGNTQAAAAEKAPVPNPGGAPAQKGAARGPKLQSYRYMVRLGSFVDKEEAEEIKGRLKANGYNAVVKTRKHLILGKVFVIQLQPVGSSSRATKLMTQLRGEFQIEPVVTKVPSR
jgi:general secretion pathway protein A